MATRINVYLMQFYIYGQQYEYLPTACGFKFLFISR